MKDQDPFAKLAEAIRSQSKREVTREKNPIGCLIAANNKAQKARDDNPGAAVIMIGGKVR